MHAAFYMPTPTLRVLEQILQADALLSKRLQQKEVKKSTNIEFNGLDYISLCCLNGKNITIPPLAPGYTAFDQYICKSLSLIFPTKELEIIEPIIVNFYGSQFPQKMASFGLSEVFRYSDYIDEVQVKDKIPLSLMSGVAIPIDRINVFQPWDSSETKARNIIIEYLEKIRELLTNYNYGDTPIYDTRTFILLNSPENIEAAIEQAKARLRKRES